MVFEFLKKGEEALIQEIDKTCKNKWKFSWLDQQVSVETVGVVKIGDSIGKINLSGKARCEWCNSLLSYSGKGLSTLKEHVKTETHVKNIKLRQSNYGLGSFAMASSAKKLFPIFAKPQLQKPSSVIEETTGNQDPSPSVSSEVLMPRIPYSDRVSTMEAMIVAYMAENSLPLTMAAGLVDFAKACSRDLQALSGVRLGKSSAAYKIKFGVAKTIKEALVEDLKSTPFSLNIDEATSTNNKKVLSILVSYTKETEVRIHHLASVELLRATSSNIYEAICCVFDRNELPWDNLVSVLSDSCAVMRGHISGVETRIRQEKAPHLLDVDGDSCHHMQIIAQSFCSPFERKLQCLFSDLYTDFKWCSEHKSSLKELCDILKVSFTVPQMYAGTRWLSSYDRALETVRMFDAYQLFYFFFLNVIDKKAYRPVIKSLLKKYELSSSARKQVHEILENLTGRRMTVEGRTRKDRIIKAIFHTSSDTMLQLELFTSVLPIFKQYVSFFQTTTPMVHKLSDFQMSAVKKFLTCFMRPENITNNLLKTEICNPSSQLPLTDIFVGHPSVEASLTFREKALQGYIAAAKAMFKKLPLNSPTLVSLSALDPSLTNHTAVKKNLDRLVGMSHFILSKSNSDACLDEVRAYVNDDKLPDYNDDEGRVDWW